MSEPVGLRLLDLAAEVDPAYAIVEIGAFCGKSTCYLAAGAKHGHGAHVWSFDAWDLEGNPPGWHPTMHGYRTAFERFVGQVQSCGLSDRVTATRAFSTDAAHDWSGPAVGLLFIDGSHLYADVAADFFSWSGWLAPGAVVAFDDFETPTNSGVTRLVKELRAGLSRWAWSFDPPPLAIGRKPL